MTSNRVILVVGDPDEPGVDKRAGALGAFLRRLGVAAGVDTELVTAPADPRSALVQAAAKACMIGTEETLRYVPTPGARRRVAEDEDGNWIQSVTSRQRKKMRSSQGAIFRLPLESDKGIAAPGADPVSIEAFVTDWTGLPGSCALAIHPAHPLSTGLDPGEHVAFTGRYCRHPLSGDLLPIYVADWVKPEFGTGAVIINPAHNAPDLAFSRAVGLPVRFALVPEGYDGTPRSWLNPPYIKSGVAIRTGIADGQTFDTAKNAYFAKIAEWGLVEPYDDAGMGAFEIGEIRADGGVEVPWDPRRGTVDPASDESLRVRVSAVLSAVEDRVRGAELTVVVPSTRVESELLALRLLLAEPGIEPSVKNAPDLVMVGGVVPPRGDVADDALQLAMITGGTAVDTVALKP